jgi:hypothetical protein
MTQSDLLRRRDLIRFSASRASSSAFGTRRSPAVIVRKREKVSSASSSVMASRASLSSTSGVAINLILHGVRRNKFFVGQAVADGVRRDGKEASAVRVLPGVVAENLLVDVPVKMKGSA